MTCGIYGIKDDSRAFVYVGQAVSIERRKGSHFSTTSMFYAPKYELVALEVVDRKHLTEREAFHIDRLTQEGHKLMNVSRPRNPRWNAEFAETTARQVSVKLNASTLKALKSAAIREGRTVAQLTRLLVELGIEKLNAENATISDWLREFNKRKAQ